jgi:CubicO group peptidase (beta-lactamase class C family)
MTEILFTLLLVVHGLIHLLGFIKAFGIAPVEQLKRDFSKAEGVLWLLSALLILCTAILFLLDFRLWPEIGLVAIVLSQLLIIASWSDAKFGTIANAIVLIAVIAVFLNPNSHQKELKSYSRQEFISHLDSRIPNAMDRYTVPGLSILLIHDEEVIWKKAYGYADSDNRTPLTTGATVMAHSISKSVTAWGVMKLMEQGVLNPDAPVQNYIRDWAFPESEYPASEITARRLLSNSSGIPLGVLGLHYSPDADLPPLRQSLSSDEISPKVKPGSQFIYSNSGYALLELLTEEITGRNFTAYMQEEILTPLGMKNSSFAWQEDMRSDIALGYDLKGTAIAPYLYPYRASGGLFTTLDDIGRFVIAGMQAFGTDDSTQSSKTVLAATGIRELYHPEVEVGGLFGLVTDAYGFGHFIETLPNGQKAVWHGGQGLGWMTHFHSVPAEGAGIVIITNSQRSWPVISEVLMDWSLWEGFGPVKFSRISIATDLFYIPLAILVLFALWKAWMIVTGIESRQRKLMRNFGSLTRRQLADFAVWALISAGLLWAVTRDYLFITSIFPVGAVWLARILLLLSLAFLISALFPVTRKESSTVKEVSV